MLVTIAGRHVMQAATNNTDVHYHALNILTRLELSLMLRDNNRGSESW